MLRPTACLFVLAIFPTIDSFAAAPPRPAAKKPTWDGDDRYSERRVRGWLVKINKELLAKEHARTFEEAMELLDHQLYRITRVIPAPALEKLRRVPIWVERAHPRHPCMCYHVSKGWLRQHHMNPNKAGAVEIANVRNFLSWSHDQP